MKASDLPFFLYLHGMMYDKGNLDSGLFQRHVVILVCFFLYLFFRIYIGS